MTTEAQKQRRWTDPDTGLIVKHPYERSKFSGAGNCWCGRAAESTLHPHAYAQASGSETCVCSKPAAAPIHTDADTARPRPLGSGFDRIREGIRQASGIAAAPQVPIRFVCRPPEQ